MIKKDEIQRRVDGYLKRVKRGSSGVCHENLESYPMGKVSTWAIYSGTTGESGGRYLIGHYRGAYGKVLELLVRSQGACGWWCFWENVRWPRSGPDHPDHGFVVEIKPIPVEKALRNLRKEREKS